MKTFLAICALLVACASSDLKGKHYIDYRLASKLQLSSHISLVQPREVTCSTPGKICDPDCKKIWTCININGELQPKLLETCKDEKTCNNGACNAVPTPECSAAGQLDFVCQSEGVFPDPITCKKYHYCILKEEETGVTGYGEIESYADEEYEDFDRTCTTHRGYNPRTTYCDKVLTNNNQCGADYPVPICTAPGQNAALKENPSLYYVCSIYENQGEILYPYLYLCPNGQTYAGNYICK